MIEYADEVFGLGSLARVHGSAVSRGVIPALLSTSLLVIAVQVFGIPIEENGDRRVTEHPYVFQVLISAITFLITYRANFAYQRVSSLRVLNSSRSQSCSIQQTI